MKFKSKVIRGQKHGSSIGYPTANLAVTRAMRDFFKREGVWVVKVKIGQRQYQGALFWGRRSLFADSEPVCEVLLLNYGGGDLYDKIIEVKIVKFLRKSIKVKNENQLKDLIINDVAHVKDASGQY